MWITSTHRGLLARVRGEPHKERIDDSDAYIYLYINIDIDIER